MSSDGGRNWRTARLQEPVLTRRSRAFASTGHGTASPRCCSRASIDETGYVQPTLAQLRDVRGTRSIYHNNAIQTWRVDPTGEVSNVQVV